MQRYYIKHCILVSWSWNVIYCYLYVRVLSFILLLLLKQTCVIWSGFETGNLIKYKNHFHFLEIPLKTEPRFKNLTTTYHRILILLLEPSEGYTQELIYYVCLRLRVVIRFVIAYFYILQNLFPCSKLWRKVFVFL